LTLRSETARPIRTAVPLVAIERVVRAYEPIRHTTVVGAPVIALNPVAKRAPAVVICRAMWSAARGHLERADFDWCAST